ncbi:MAG: hypothetical protein O7E57_06455 [Gammaproteobacteria bacterium]|nr:hypothetical protein [Gammaproteobacteria bacterium]
MLITFPDGTHLPVNYLRETDKVYVTSDFGWWKRFDPGANVTLLIKGETLNGYAHAITNDPAYTKDVFARLRPTVPDWLPDRLQGVLVVIELSDET